MAVLDQYGNEYPSPTRFAHGASRSRARGPQFQDRNADIDKLIPSHDRKALVSISSRLFMNMGVPKAAIMQKADYSVGEAWLPSYVGASDMADGKGIAAFLRGVWFPSCDVRGGVHDWHKLLELTSIALDRDGDAFWLLIKGDDGFPRIQQIPSHRVDSGYSPAESTVFQGYKPRDGIFYNKGGRPIGYRVITGDDGSKFEDIPAKNMIHIFDPSYQEQGRGLPAFTHAIEDLKHSLVSTEDERIRQLIISRLHLLEYNDTGGPDMDDPRFALDDTARDTTDADSTGIVYQNMAGGVRYLKANSGHKLEMMKHENPGEIWENFQDRMIRSALASVWSYGLSWKGAGQGTDTRLDVVKARRAVVKRQKTIRFAARLAISWAYSVFRENKRVPLLDHPMAWAFTTPPRLTVDDGREAAAMRDNFRMGSTNLSDLLEAEGKTYEEHTDQRILEIVYRETKRLEAMEKNPGITIEPRDLVMLTPNEMAAQPAAATPQKDEDNPDDE